MGAFRIEMTIDRPPAAVFAVLADAAAMPRWYEAVEAVVPTGPGPAQPGSRFEITRVLPGGRVHNDVELTELIPPRRVTLESRRGPTPFRYRYDLAPTTTGTRLTLAGEISAVGLPGPTAVLDPLATQLFKRGMTRNLSVLKQLVEDGPRR